MLAVVKAEEDSLAECMELISKEKRAEVFLCWVREGYEVVVGNEAGKVM